MLNEAQIQEYMDTAERLSLWPKIDSLTAFLEDGARRHNLDWQLAPIWARHLVHTFPKVFRHKYPGLDFANGDVLPIDSSIDPADKTWEYFEVDSGGCADFIDDDGHKMPTVAPMRAGRHEGKLREIGIRYLVNMFDEERWAKASSRGNLPGIQLLATKLADAKKAHDTLTDWLWAFGNGEKGFLGLLNHPNIQVSVAPFSAGAPTSRSVANKTAEENMRDFLALIDLVASATLEQYHAATVWLPHSHIRTLRGQFIAATATGMVTVWDRIKQALSGDDSGQGKVTLKGMYYADSARRLDPRTIKGNPILGPLAGSGTDTSGLAGNFMLALPPENKDELCFIRARPFTQRPPREIDDFNTSYATHSKIGGTKAQQPLAVHRLDYGTV